MMKWSVAGLLSCLGVASLAHANAASSVDAVAPSSVTRSAPLTQRSHTPEGASRPRRKALQLGGNIPCIAPQIMRPDQGLGAFQEVPAAGGTFSILVFQPSREQCGGGVSENSDFVVDLKVTSADHMDYKVLPNTGAARVAVLEGNSNGEKRYFEVRQAAGSAPTTPTPTPTTPPAASALSNDVSVLGEPRTCGTVAMTTLKPGAVLKPGTWVLSPSRQYKLIYQTDGNLVLYRASGEVVWANGKRATGGLLKMQTDGNLVSYDSANRANWATNTAKKGTLLGVQDDNNLVIYGATGCTATWARR